MFTAFSCITTHKNCGVLLRIEAQAQTSPFDHPSLTGAEVFHISDALARTGRPNVDIPEMEPEFARAFSCQGIVAIDRFLHVTYHFGVIDLRKTQIAGLQQGRVLLADPIEVADAIFD